MSRLFSSLRRLFLEDDARAARREEVSLQALPSSGAAGSASGGGRRMEPDGPSYLLGESVLSKGTEIRAAVGSMLGRHGVVNGASGSGKSRASLGLVMQDIHHFAHAPRRRGLAYIEHKSETAGMVLSLVERAASRLDGAAARALLDATVDFNPFGQGACSP